MPPLRISQLVWRHVPRDAHPLHIGWILRARGRWNREGVYGCLYTAMSQAGAEAEFARLMMRTLAGPFAADPARLLRGRDLVSIQVTVEPVLDLTSDDVLTSNAISPATLVGDDDTSIEACRSIADWARQQGFRALLAPSAAIADARNLMIYLEGPAASLRLEAGPDRIPLAGWIY